MDARSGGRRKQRSGSRYVKRYESYLLCDTIRIIPRHTHPTELIRAIIDYLVNEIDERPTQSLPLPKPNLTQTLPYLFLNPIISTEQATWVT